MNTSWRSARRGPALRILTVSLGAAAALSLASCSSGSGNSTTTTTSASSGAAQSLKSGITALKAGNYAQAESYFRQAISQDPTNASGLKALAYYNLGVALGSAGATPLAIAAYKSSLELDPTSTSALFNLAEVQSASDPASALANYNKILAIKANDTDTLFNSGLIMYSQGDTTGGVARIKQAISQDATLAGRVPSNVNLG
jgi:tetratricopeptide (TPR) repeat protein